MASVERVVGINSAEHCDGHHGHHDNIIPDNDETPSLCAPLTRVSSFYTPSMENKLQRKLKFFFMDPCSKFKARRKIPWKLILQILKVIVVTVQVYLFGLQRYSIVEYFEKNHIALKHLLLKNWDPSFETMPYPPATGAYAIYTRQELAEYINFAMYQYYHTPNIALASFRYRTQNETLIPPMEFCQQYYNTGKIFPNGSFIINPEIVFHCFDLFPIEFWNTTTNSTDFIFDIDQVMKKTNNSFEWDRLLEVDLKLSYNSYHLNLFAARWGPACFSLNITVAFDNRNRDGQMLIAVNMDATEIKCHNMNQQNSNGGLSQIVFDGFVIGVCILSCALCLRSVYRAQKLRKETVIFFNNRFGKQLSMSDKSEFINLWYLLIIINDILTVTGSAFKIQLEDQLMTFDASVGRQKFKSSSQNYDVGSLMLGVGLLLAWIGILRYLGFFKTYNVLILTLKAAFPNVLRFMVCTLCMYFGFVFCGWLVLGPYHIKFRRLSTASECLYSLVNGDDMFVTFSATVTDSQVIWYFSRTYLYIFISLFIYVVLSLFIALIMDTYETLKHHYENGFPRSDLWKFIDQCKDSPDSELYRRDNKGCNLFDKLFCCCKDDDPDKPSERKHLLHRSL
ncbi:mucolipin-3-like isoform X2 [Gigantopelta aegis]|nr:mucolipin-3-like isoform X2 [Gigantopelta aegis]